MWPCDWLRRRSSVPPRWRYKGISFLAESFQSLGGKFRKVSNHLLRNNFRQTSKEGWWHWSLRHPAQLKNAVESPGGTTIAGEVSGWGKHVFFWDIEIYTFGTQISEFNIFQYHIPVIWKIIYLFVSVFLCLVWWILLMDDNVWVSMAEKGSFFRYLMSYGSVPTVRHEHSGEHWLPT